MIRAFIPFLASLACAGAAVAAPDLDAATAAFREGNAAYEQGDYEGARAAYQRAEDAGARDARLYYNHANALFRSDRLGLAILHYEKARKLAPTDADILHNLNFARARVADKIAEPPTNAFTRLLERAHSSYSPAAGLWIALGLFAAGFFALAAGLFLPAAGRISAVIAAVACFAALLAFSPSLIYKVRQQGMAVRAVVLEPAVGLYSGPGENYELLFRAHEGTVFSIVGRDDKAADGEPWLAVKLPDGRSGFVKARNVGEV